MFFVVYEGYLFLWNYSNDALNFCNWWIVQFYYLFYSDAVKKIQKVYEILHIRNIFFAWRYAVQDSKRSKEYFEVPFEDIFTIERMVYFLVLAKSYRS